MLRIENLIYRVEGRPILDGAGVHVPAGHKVGVVGRNGAGKSTLLRLIMGEIAPDAGKITIRRGAHRAMVAQEAPGGEATLIDTVLAADGERSALLAEAEGASEPGRIAEIHQRLADIEAHRAPARAAAILAGLGFDEEAQGQSLSGYSGGWRMRVGLAAALFAAPDLLLLDEPTNYLDLEGTIWLEGYLARYPRTILIVSHDRELLNRAASAILHVDRGQLSLFRGGYDDFERQRTERLVLQRKANEKLTAQRRHMQAFVDRFRYQANKARQAQSRLRMLEKMAVPAVVLEDSHWRFAFPQPAELRPPLIAADDAAVGYEAGRPVLSGMNFRLDPGDRIALLGRNGNGKSTLAKLLSGRLEAMAGTLQRHRKLSVGYFAQHQIEDLDPSRTARQHLADCLPEAKEAALRARLGGFGLLQETANVAAEALSGGERARLVLAMITAQAPELLVLDEPTNHLDVDARDALIQALNDYTGAVLLISHDRHLIELVADELWLVADGRVEPWDGDMDDYRAQFIGRRGGAKARASKPAVKSDNRRASRQAGAAQRARRAPLKQALDRAEARVAKLGAELKRIDAELAHPGTYDGEDKAPVALLKRQGEVKRDLAAAEAAWLEAAGRLEEMKR